jgi:hypothetical protein
MTRRRALLAAGIALAIVSAALSVAIAVGGGSTWRVGSIRISARDATNPAILAAGLVVVVWLAATRDERAAVSRTLRAWGSQPRQLARPVVVCLAVSVFLLGAIWGGRVAAGADASGYVTQADLWAHGRLIVEQPFAEQPAWPIAPAAVAPLGYRVRASPDHRADLVPTYSPGLPLTMALFEIIGGRAAVFFVVPLLAALAIWATFMLGRQVGGPLLGAGSAVLLAASPSFLFEVTSPTSDVPTTAWWTLALALVIRGERRTSLVAGLAASAAIVTRPNVVPIVMIPIAFLVWQAVRTRRPGTWHATVFFVIGVLPGAALIGLLNWYWYGSPASSGYGDLDQIYSTQYLLPNLARYPIWFLRTQTPFVLLAFAAPLVLILDAREGLWRAPRRDVLVMLVSFALAVFSCYLFYRPWDDWGYLRFLLPAYPAVLILVLAGLDVVVRPMYRWSVRLPAIVAVAAVVIVASVTVRFAVEQRLLQFWRDNQRYLKAGTYIAERLPENAVILAVEHSSSARFYSGRITARFDLLPEGGLDRLVGQLHDIGYHPYLLVDYWEEPSFSARFQTSRLARLDWVPVATIVRGHTRIYDLAGDASGGASRRSPDIVD